MIQFLKTRIGAALLVLASSAALLFAYAQLPTSTTGVATFFVQVSFDSTGYPGSTTAFVPGDYPEWSGSYTPPLIDAPQWKENQIDFPVGQPYRKGKTRYPYGYVASYRVGNTWTTTEPADNTLVSSIKFRYDPVTSTLQPPPATSVNFSGGGDGYEVIPFRGKLYVVNHHIGGNYIKCFDAVTAQICDGWQGGNHATDGSKTSNQPVHYLNRSNGKLYYPVANNRDLGFDCFDLINETGCGFTAFDIGGGGYASIVGMGVVNNRLYAVSRGGTVGCIDGLTGQLCSLTRPGNYTLPNYQGGTTGSGAVADNFLFTLDNAGSVALHCFDDAKVAPCSGSWPVAAYEMGPRILTNPNGSFKAACTQYGQCFTATGAAYTPVGNETGMHDNNPTMWSYTRGITYQRKVFSWNGDIVDCHDLNTGSQCAGFPYTGTNGLHNYTIIADPERPDCLWTNSDYGTARSFNALTGGQCLGSGGTPVTLRAKPGTAYQCQPGGANPTWKAVVLSAPASGTVTAKIYNDATGTLIDTRTFATGTKSLSISDISYAAHPELKVDLTLGTSGNGQTVSADILWDGPPPQFCAQTKTAQSTCVVTGDWSSKSGLPGNATPNYAVSINGKGLSSAAPLVGYNVAAGSSSLDLADSPFLFKGRFDERKLSGDLEVTRLDPNLGSEILDATGQPKVYATASASGVIPVFGSRRVITQLPNSGNTPGATIPFRWANLDPTQQALLNKNLLNASDTMGSQRLDYLRGSTAAEASSYGTVPAGKLRKRAGPLGMVLGSGMVYVPAQMPQGQSEKAAPGYENYLLNPQRTQNMVFFAANDGMLHGFTVSVSATSAVTLSEQFAYLPRRLLGVMNRYTDATPLQLWTDPYFHDNTPMVNDIRRNGTWNTVLVSTFGRGAPGFAALNITQGDAITESSSGAVIREFSDVDDADMGHIVSQPVLNHNGYATQIVQVKRNGTVRPAVITGNGVNSANGNAALFVVYLDAAGGYDKLVLPGVNNGLSAPRVVDFDGDGVVDRVYAGDLLGNVWSIDLKSTNAMSSRLLFQASAPIASAPVVKTFSPVGQCYRCMMVNVVTGKPTAGPLLNDYNVGTHTAYGLWDTNDTSPIVGGDLVSQTLVSNGAGQYTVNDRSIGYSVLASSKRGWSMDLPAGHMVVANPDYLSGSTLVFSTVIAPTGSGASCLAPRSLTVALESASANRARLGFFGHATWSAMSVNALIFGAQPLVTGGSSGNLAVNPNGGTTAFVPKSALSKRLSWQEIER